MHDCEPFPLPSAADDYAAWEARCRVSHAGHFESARNAAVAFAPPGKPLHALRVALATSGGLHLRGDQPFDLSSHAGDDSIRWIPGNVDVRTLEFSHDHYDHTDPDQDPNCMFPIERLRELAAEGIIGSVAAAHIGFMGWIPNPARFCAETVPQVVGRLRADQVDALIISPG